MSQQSQRVTKKQKRIQKQQGVEVTTRQQPFKPIRIDPLTYNQERTFDAFDDGRHLLLHGIAGTGKTFCALYLAIQEVMEPNSQYKKVVIVRSVVPTRDMGFLPGSAKDKAKVYEAPYYIIASELFERGDAYELLKNKNLVEFISTSFIRGTTLNDCIVIVDEMQNMLGSELDSIITRIGKNCRVIFSGDFRQSDFRKNDEKAGMKDFLKIVSKMKNFEHIEFNRDDIIRSALVKEYIIAKDDLNINFN